MGNIKENSIDWSVLDGTPMKNMDVSISDNLDRKIGLIDTSIDGFRYIGINLTQEQFEDLQTLNLLMTSKDRNNIPVFNIMIALKIMGLLKSETTSECSDNKSNNDFDDVFQRKFGRII